MQEQNEKMLAGVMEQYTSMSLGTEEEKKSKLEQLYDQIVSFQESIDTARATLETTAREVDADAQVCVCVWQEGRGRMGKEDRSEEHTSELQSR